MKYCNQQRYILYRVVISMVFGCALALLSGCDKRKLSGDTAGPKAGVAIYATNAAVAPVAGTINETALKSEEIIDVTTTRSGTDTENATAAKDDAAITRSIKEALGRDPLFNRTNVYIKSVQGEVTLKGEALDSEQRAQTERIVTAVPGVVKVNNYIRINWNK